MPDRIKETIRDESQYLREARERFKESENGMSDIIDSALDDLAMVDGEKQWDADIEKFRKDKGMVVITENLLPSFLDQVDGDFRQNKPQVNVKAVDGKADPETARILEGMLRNIDYQSQAESIHDEAFLAALSSSFGGWRIGTQYDDPMSMYQEIIIEPIENHMSLRWDLDCKKFDTSDKRWAQILSSMSKKDFEDTYPDAEYVGYEKAKGTEFAGWYRADGSIDIAEYWRIVEKTVSIVQLSDGSVIKKDDLPKTMAKIKQFLQGQPLPKVIDERETQIPTVYSSIISGHEILDGPYEWPGRYIPIPIVFGKRMNLNGKMRLKSLIRDAKQSQRMHNYLISSMVQGVAMQSKAPYVGTVEQMKGKAKEWQSGLDGDVPYLTVNSDSNAPGFPQRQAPPQLSQGYAELLQFNAKTRMDIIGIHEAGLGMRSNEQSGIAIQARQHEGDTGTFVFLDNMRKALAFDYRIRVDLIPKIYDVPRMVRIIGFDGKEGFAQLYEKAIGPKGPYLKANPKVGKYDVVVATGPSYSTLREKTQDGMTKIIQAVPAVAPILLPSWIRSMDWQDADRIAQALTLQLPPAVQQILSSDPQKGEQQPDPRMIQMQQAMNQQIGQMQQGMQQLQQENEQLKSGIQKQMAEIEAKKELSKAEIEFKKEELKQKAAMHDSEMHQKMAGLMEELKAKYAMEITLFIEKLNAEKELKKSGDTETIKASVSV